MKDFQILNTFVLALRDENSSSQDRMVAYGVALLALIANGHTDDQANALIDKAIAIAYDKPTEAQRRRREREARADRLREIRAEAHYNW